MPCSSQELRELVEQLLELRPARARSASCVASARRASTIVADAREVQVEERVVRRQVDGALHHRRAQHVLARPCAVAEPDEVERAERVHALGQRHAHAVLAQQARRTR